MTQSIKESVERLLAAIVDPHTGQNLSDSGELKGIGVDGGKVAIDIVLGYPARTWESTLAQQVRDALKADPAIVSALVGISSRVHAHKVQNDLTPLPNVKNILAIASGSRRRRRTSLWRSSRKARKLVCSMRTSTDRAFRA
jgi:ATP-binding protein involved in chromosome partitioning